MCIRFNGILSEPPDLKNDFSNGHLPGECDLGRGRVVTFVHTNGFHYLPVFPCSCERALEEPLQHIESGYYPATFKHVSTVFTFRLLQHFHLHRVDAHMASESYCSILSRLTNYTFPFLSPVSYSFTRHRVWDLHQTQPRIESGNSVVFGNNSTIWRPCANSGLDSTPGVTHPARHREIWHCGAQFAPSQESTFQRTGFFKPIREPFAPSPISRSPDGIIS
jgi:hypothetical protein